MAYNKAHENINWQNLPSEATALNAINLNKMDNSIDVIDDRVIALDTARITDEASLANKVDKVAGKGLSTNDYTDADKAIVDGVTTALAGKVDKEEGKGLSSNDYTTAEKNKLAGISADAKNVSISDTLADGTVLANITIDGTTTAIKGSDIEVDEELSPTSTNPVENKAIYDALNNLLPSKTVSGNPIAISDASGFNAKALTVSMNPIQDLHGYEYPWVGGVGKNKFSCVDSLNPSSNLSATKNADGSVRIYGTPNSTWGAISDVDDCNLPAGQYTFSIQSAVAYNIYTQCYVGGTNTNRAINAGQTSITFTVSGTITQIRLMISGMTNGTPIDITIKPMWASGTDTVFAPYSNICPIIGRTGTNILQGKNSTNIYKDTGVIPFNSNTAGVEFHGDNSLRVYAKTNSTYQSSRQYLSNYSNLVNGKKYAIFANAEIKSGIALIGVRNSANAIISEPVIIMTTSGTCMCTFTMSSEASFLSFFCSWDTQNINADVKYTNIRFVEYEKLITKQFGQTVYGGSLDLNSGVLTIDRGFITYDGTENWQLVSGTNRFYYNSLPSNIDKSSAISNSRVYRDSPSDIGGYFYFGGSSVLFNRTVADQTADQFKAELVATPVQVCYLLATAIIIQLSPEAVTLLKGQNVISTDGDKVQVEFSDIPVGDYSVLLDYIKSLEARIEELEG